MNNLNDQKIAIAPTISKLEINETASFPQERYNTVRSTCTNLSIYRDVRYTTRLDRSTRTITVTRIQ